MKYLVTTALALSLLAGGAAFAQDRHDDRGDRGGRGEGRAEERGGGPDGGGPRNRSGQPLIQQQQAPQAQQRPQAPQAQQRPQAAPQQPQFQGRGGGDQRFDRGGGQRGPDQNFDRGRQGGDQRFDRGRGPDQRFDGGRPGGPQFDRGRPGQGFNGGFRPRAGGFLDNRHWSFNQRFRGPAYRYPRGFGYQYWAFGSFLPSVYLAPDYTLYDYWTYGLPAPPPAFHWIRVGPDALLVRYGDGYVLDAAYGLFY